MHFYNKAGNKSIEDAWFPPLLLLIFPRALQVSSRETLQITLKQRLASELGGCR